MKKKENRYTKFFENFGKNIKLGVIEDNASKTKLAKLLRFYSSRNPKLLISFDDYIKNMKEGQDVIYYIAGENKDELRMSPLIQKLIEKDINVLLLDDTLDEFAIQSLSEYERKKFKNVGKGDIDLKEGDEARKRDKKVQDAFKPLTEWWKKYLGSKIERIEISKRLTDTPCIIVSSEYGTTANVERIQKAQAFANKGGQQQDVSGRKILEINSAHPAIQELLKRVKEQDKPDDTTTDVAELLYEAALLSSGYSLTNPHEFSDKMERVINYSLNLDRHEKVVPMEVEVEEDEKPKEEGKSEEPPKTEDAPKTEETKKDDL